MFASNVSSLQQEVVALSTLKETVMQLTERIKVVHEAVCECKPTHLGQAVDNFNSQVMDDLTPECSTASDKSSYAGVAVAGDVTDFIMQTNRKKRQNSLLKQPAAQQQQQQPPSPNEHSKEKRTMFPSVVFREGWLLMSVGCIKIQLTMT